MRILQAISSAGFYGAESMLLSLSEALERMGCTSNIAVFRDARDPHVELAEAAARKGIATCVVPCRGRWDWSAVRRFTALIDDFGADVVHTHGYKADLYLRAAVPPQASRESVLFSTCHNWADRSIAMQVYAAVDRAALRFFDHVTTPSAGVAEILLRSGLSAERVSVIRNGIDTTRFNNAAPALRAGLGLHGKPIVGFVGRLTAGKGGHVLIRAARHVLEAIPDAHFIFAGDGPQLGTWTALAKEVGVAANVTLLGSRNDMPSVYASFDVMALPSFDEAMPMCLLEAMAAGIPVVATPVGAVRDLVKHEDTGLLVPPADEEALAVALIRILAERKFAASMAARARTCIVQSYSSEKMARQYLELYQKAIGNRPAGQQVRKQTASS